MLLDYRNSEGLQHSCSSQVTDKIGQHENYRQDPNMVTGLLTVQRNEGTSEGSYSA